MTASILVRYIIGGEIWLNDCGGIAVYYLFYIQFELRAAGDTPECRLDVIFFTSCIVKLYSCITFCSACLILILSNDISHMGIKLISWR